MKRTSLHATVWKEDDWYVARCIEVNVASQGKSHQEAVNNLKEALELYFEDSDEVVSQIEEVEVEQLTV